MGNNNIFKVKEILNEKKMVTTKDLSKLLNVSPMSITRYLNNLEEEGFIERTHGGAILLEENKRNSETDFSKRIKINEKIKSEIARKAASYVFESNTIFIDSGSTTIFLLDYLVKNIVIYTNSIYTALDAIEKGFLNVNIIGGRVKPVTLASVDPLCKEAIEKLNFHYVFLGTNSFNSMGALTTPDSNEGFVKELISSRSNEIIVLADSAKYNKTTFYNFTPKKYKLVTDYSGKISNQKFDVEKIEVKNENI